MAQGLRVPEGTEATRIMSSMEEMYEVRTRDGIYQYLTAREYKDDGATLMEVMAKMDDADLYPWFARMCGEWLAKEVGVL